MRRYPIAGLALILAVSAGCSSAPTQARLDPGVESLPPAPTVVYASPSSTAAAAATAPASTTAPASATALAAPSTAAMQPPAMMSDTASPDSTPVPAAGATTLMPGPGTPTPAPVAGPITMGPAAAIVTTVPGVIQTLRAEDIQTKRGRANAIYANRIEAGEIRGIIHQDTGLKVADARGDVRVPEVTYSIIYADKIKADSIVADHIYVRDLRRR